MLKKYFYVLHLAAILLVISLRAFGQNVPSVKIIHFGAGNADCTLIVVKDFDTKTPTPGFHTITILIDTGVGRSSKSKVVMGTATNLWEEVWKRIQKEGANQLDYLVISHLDNDHIGNGKGFLDIIQTKKRMYTWKDKLVIIDRLAFEKTEAEKDPKVSEYRLWDAPSTNATNVNRYQSVYKKQYGRRPDPNDPAKKRELDPQRRFLFFGQDLFKLNTQYTLKNVQMICVASNGVIGDKRKAIPVGNIAGTAPKGENDLCFAFLLRFGSFRYYTGSDIDDNPAETPMEKHLVDQMRTDWNQKHGALNPFPKFHACAIKVNHHGSRFGTQQPFVDYFDPKIAVYSAGLRIFPPNPAEKKVNRHPSEDVINRLAVNAPVCMGGPPSIRQQLFTFRIKSGNKLDANPMDYLAVNKNWKKFPKGGSIQDVILYVQEEKNGSPLNNLPPKIYIFKTYRSMATYAPQSPKKPVPAIPPGAPTPTLLPEDFANDPAVIECDRVDDCTTKKHKNLELPERPALISPKKLDLLSQLRLLFGFDHHFSN